MNIKELKEYLGTEERYVVFFGEFGYELFIDEENNKEYIFITPFFEHEYFVDKSKKFMNTETAIKHIKRDLKRAAKEVLAAIKEHDMEQKDIQKGNK